MSIEEFAANFADAIEVPPETISGDTAYKGLEIWDSLCLLVVIAMVDAHYNVALSGDEVTQQATVADLYKVVSSRSK